MCFVPTLPRSSFVELDLSTIVCLFVVSRLPRCAHHAQLRGRTSVSLRLISVSSLFVHRRYCPSYAHDDIIDELSSQPCRRGSPVPARVPGRQTWELIAVEATCAYCCVYQMYIQRSDKCLCPWSCPYPLIPGFCYEHFFLS